MTTPTFINQRDLRMRSKEIMDAVERGERFTVTRDGRAIAELAPGPTRRYLPRAEFAAASSLVIEVDLDRFRHSLDSALDFEVSDPYAR